MDKSSARDQKTEKNKMKIQIKTSPNRKARRRDLKRNRRIDHQGHGYGTSNANKGASGKCKYLIVKEKLLEQERQLKSVKSASPVEVYGGRKMERSSVVNVLEDLNKKKETR